MCEPQKSPWFKSQIKYNFIVVQSIESRLLVLWRPLVGVLFLRNIVVLLKVYCLLQAHRESINFTFLSDSFVNCFLILAAFAIISRFHLFSILLLIDTLIELKTSLLNLSRLCFLRRVVAWCAYVRRRAIRKY